MAVLAVALPLLASYTPQEAVNKFVSHSSLRYASVGVQVIDLDSAKSIACYRPEQANITASTMKTVVSSAALGLMGPHFRFETPVYLDGEVRNGCLYGNLIVKGMGDPTLGANSKVSSCVSTATTLSSVIVTLSLSAFVFSMTIRCPCAHVMRMLEYSEGGSGVLMVILYVPAR